MYQNSQVSPRMRLVANTAAKTLSVVVKCPGAASANGSEIGIVWVTIRRAGILLPANEKPPGGGKFRIYHYPNFNELKIPAVVCGLQKGSWETQGNRMFTRNHEEPSPQLPIDRDFASLNLYSP
jgi:hypothetical protein